MAARDNAASVQGDAIRITPLNIDGTIDTSKPVLTTTGFISASFAADIEDGDEITEKGANGKICIQYKADASLKGITFNLSLCSPDPEASAIVAGGQVIAKKVGSNVEINGYTSPPVGASVGAPVAVEIWSKAIVEGKPAAGAPYWHWVFPYLRLRYDGDREFSNGALSNSFSGSGVGNDALASSGLNPANDNDDFMLYRRALVNPFSYVRDISLPAAGWTGSFDTDDPLLAIVAEPTAVTAFAAGSPGVFTPEEGTPPLTLAELNALGLTHTDPFDVRAIGTIPEWLEIGDGSYVASNGTTFVAINSISPNVSDLAPGAASFSDLASLVASPTQGDGNFSGGTFAAGQYIKLADNSLASYDGTNWSEGAAS